MDLCYPHDPWPHLGTGAILRPNFPELALTKLRDEQELQTETIATISYL